MVGFAARRGGACLRWLSLALAALLLSGSATAADSKIVLVLYASTRLLPAAVEVDRALREGFAAASSTDRPIELYTEFLDLPRFSGDAFVRTFSTYLRDKYSANRPDVILAVGSDAVELLVRHRAELFPRTPVVYIASTKALIAPLEPLPAGVVGVPVVYDTADTIDQALRWHPRAHHLAVVTGASPQDIEQAGRMRDEVAPFADRLTIEFISELPAVEVEKRVAALPPDTIVFTPGWFADGAKRLFAPREAAEMIARAADAPVYGPYNTFIGTGIVAGVVPSYEGMGQQGVEIVRQILDGAAPESLALPSAAPTQLEVDWRQARRWGIREADIPAGAVIRFKEPTFWEAYKNVAIGASAIMAFQAALITALLLERRQRRRTAAALDESERRMGLAARAAALSTWLWEFDRDLPAGRDTPASADRERVEKAAAEAFARDQELSVEYRVQRPEGGVRWLMAHGRADRSGEGRRLLGVSREVTERKEAELAAEQDRAALRHMTRVSTLGQLSASIAHQLNQPLTAIMSNAEAARQLLGREHVDVAELREICDDILSADQRAAEVIRRLSALFRHEEVQRQPVDLNELLADTLELTRDELLSRHIVVATELREPLPSVEAGRIQLQQVFLNLVMNAADAMQDTVEAERSLVVRTDAKDGQVRVSVSDVGSGILARDIQKIFDPFWSTKSGGMGMGLAVCRTILDAHRGALTARNNPDRGATFCVTLPAIAE